MNRIPAIILVLLLPLASQASGHNNGLEYLPVVGVIICIALFTALLNLISYIVAARSNNTGLLWVCLVLNALWLCYCIYVMAGRYQQHVAYQAYGAGVDKEGYANFNSKAFMILFMVSTAVIIDLVLISRKNNYNRRLQ